MPANGIGFSLSCLLEEGPEAGQHVCYFTQPHSISPLSMTCSVGDCLYEEGDPIIPPATDTVVIPRVDEQMTALMLLGALVLGMCMGFDGLSRLCDWATSPKGSRPAGRETISTGLLAEDGLAALSLNGTSSASASSPSKQDHQALLLGSDGGVDVAGGAGGASTGGEMIFGSFATDEPFAFNRLDAAEASPIITWSNLSLWVPDHSRGRAEKRILCSVTGMAGRAEGREAGGGITALMGPSGAGKTTLLNVLARRHTSYSRLEGELRVNGRVLSSSQLQAISGYVTQHDVLPGMMTVREHLLFHAKLRMGSKSMRAKQERVTKVLDELGLSDIHGSIIGDEFVRGISGGERRRVSIASELLASPALLLLDEPTTGLDR